jgi:hypothetical protein
MKSLAEDSQMADFANQRASKVPERRDGSTVKRFSVQSGNDDDSDTTWSNSAEGENVNERLLEEDGDSRWQQLTSEFLVFRRTQLTRLFWAKLGLFFLCVILLGGLTGAFYPKALGYHIEVSMLANIKPNSNIFSNFTNETCEGALFDFEVRLDNMQLISNIRILDVDIRMLASTIQISNLTWKDMDLLCDIYIL